MGKKWLYIKRAFVYNILVGFVGLILIIFLILIGTLFKTNLADEKGNMNIVISIALAPVLLLIEGFLMTKVTVDWVK